ncbi:helix-turn-helix transcriptional regulator [Castellaniella sp.]|uniref:helix-turn-helix transcriptional regulator n=1 Tax=Castellaniella sp. TaxID=1955812 RepID=UPI002AFF4433|nr:WYL domain-containing protein [Castellaniella sp.]
MAKRSSTLETTLLALEMLRRIPRAPRSITASELHEQLAACGFERDLRTIQRQLDMLSTHLDIERDDRSVPYQYRWLPHARPLAIPHLSPQESLLLKLAEEHLRPLLPAHLMKSMEGFFVQARHNLGPDGKTRLEREWPSKIRMVATSQPLLPPKIVPGVLETVSEALYHNHWLRLDYRNAGGRRNTVEVMPLGLAQQGPRLYLVCRYRGFGNERSLALHRILNAEQASTIAFERPLDFDLAGYDADGRFRFGEGERIRLCFRIDRNIGQHLQETPLSRDQTVVEREDGRLEIAATVVDSAMLDQWLRGFGDAVDGVEKAAAK